MRCREEAHDRRHRWPRAALFVALLGVLVPSPAAAPAKTLVLNNPGDAPLTRADGSGFLDRLVGEAFRRAGLELVLVRLPAERGLRDANAGIADGDLSRIAGIERLYTNLLRVPESTIETRFSAFTRGEAFVTDGWHSLAGRRVGIIKGWKILERNLGEARDIVYAKSARQLFRLLERDRVDVVLYAERLGREYLRANGLTDVRVLAPPLEVQSMYIYLNARHRALVPRIAAALREMKADGSYARHLRETPGMQARE